MSEALELDGVPMLFEDESVAWATRSLPRSQPRSVAEARERRTRELAAGRACADRALGSLGVEARVGEDRAPVWPAGFTGSISHKGERCVAAAAPLGRILGIGIDLENGERLEDETFPWIFRAAEIDALRSLPAGTRALFASAAFSAKESIYKCVRPYSGRFLDFREVRIDLDPERSLFRASLPSDVARLLPEGSRVDGRMLVSGRWILTGALLLRSIDGSRIASNT
jgi:4'-phosphopantetheinyl transferase EntD